MAVTTTKTNKPINPRGNDQSPKGYNRAALYSGKALSFDGVNDVLTMPTALTSSLSTTSVTFVTNVKTDFATWTGTRDDAFSFSERGVILAFNNGTIYYYYRHQSASWRNLQVPNANFKPQEWNQMVTTIDLNADTWKAYINGIEVASSGTYSDTAIAYDSNALTIGAQSGSRFFDGQIAGFKIFNTALTAAQVADLYNNPEKIVPTGVADSALKLWLPMMEGAGTTAYDGSGNGNHGTISGATWTHGVGSPVAQSAVIDWNKGQNNLTYSEDFSQYQYGGTLTRQSGYLAPDGSNNAYKITSSAGNGSIYLPAVSGANYYRSIWARTTSGTGTVDLLSYFENTNNTFTITEEWQRFEVSTTDSLGGVSNFYAVDFRNTSATLNEVIIWGGHTKADSSSGPYVPTFGTAQTSDVLLPQGLTTGRDITGVNLFENVRKQGALNLDGNSWAEVHDNASIDLSDANASFEAWVYHIDKGAVSQYIMNKFDGTTGVRMRTESSNNFGFYASDGTNNIADNGTEALTANAWNHIVLTTDGTNFKRYINGALADTDVAGTPLTTFANADSLYIGSEQTTTSLTESRIAQPRIYNRALTAEEIQRNFDAGKYTYTND